MPSSAIETLPPVVRTVLSLEPCRVVDLGMGTGKYGLVLREQIDWAQNRRTFHITGVEGWDGYIGDHQKLAYDDIVTADIRDYLANANGTRFDVALLLDVIEHFSPEDAVTVMDGCLRIADVVIVATPSAWFVQPDENELEWHRSWWPKGKLQKLGERLEAYSDVAKVEHKMFATYSRSRKIPVVRDPLTKAVARSVRDKLMPALSGGPTI